jgi:tetratricopeptide (TPR) repeat protein
VEELLPFVPREYRTKDYRILVGPQAGAEFGLYTLGRRPGVFDAFMIENPFRFGFLYEPLAAATADVAAKGLPSPTFLHIVAADRAGRMDKSAEMEHMREFERTVRERRPPNLVLVARYVERSEDFLPPLMLQDGLRELFREYRFPADRSVKRLADITDYYASLSSKLGFEVDVPEIVLASKADDLVSAGDRGGALELLEYLVDRNPRSLDGWWRLANVHRELGDRAEAVACYRTCLEIMPAMRPAREWIEKLEKGQ